MHSVSCVVKCVMRTVSAVHRVRAASETPPAGGGQTEKTSPKTGLFCLEQVTGFEPQIVRNVNIDHPNFPHFNAVYSLLIFQSEY